MRESPGFVPGPGDFSYPAAITIYNSPKEHLISEQATRWVWEHSKAIGDARLVLLALAHLADDEGYSTATLEVLGRMSNLGGTSGTATNRAWSAVGALIESGELVKTQDGRTKRTKGGSEYRLLMPSERDICRAELDSLLDMLDGEEMRRLLVEAKARIYEPPTPSNPVTQILIEKRKAIRERQEREEVETAA